MKYIALIVLFICLGWGLMGFIFGVEYQKGQQYIEKQYIYKNTCLAEYKGAWIPYNCADTLIEGDQ